jgi:chromosome segregation ATPase
MRGYMKTPNANSSLEDLRRELANRPTQQALDELQVKLDAASTDLKSSNDKLNEIEPPLQQCRNELEHRPTHEEHDEVNKQLSDVKEQLRQKQLDSDELQKELDQQTELDGKIGELQDTQKKLRESEKVHGKVNKQLSGVKEQLGQKQLDSDELQKELDQQTELDGKIGELQDTQKKLHKSEDEVRARPPAAMHSNLKKSLDAVTADRDNLVINLARAEADLQNRPTEMEHKTLQIDSC